MIKDFRGDKVVTNRGHVKKQSNYPNRYGIKYTSSIIQIRGVNTGRNDSVVKGLNRVKKKRKAIKSCFSLLQTLFRLHTKYATTSRDAITITPKKGYKGLQGINLGGACIIQ